MSSAVEPAGGERRRGALEDAERLHAVAVGASRRPSTRARRRCARTSRAPRPRAGGSPRAPARRSCRGPGDGAEHEPVAGRELLARDALLDPVVRPLGLALSVGAIVDQFVCAPCAGTSPSTRRSSGRARRRGARRRPARRSRRPRPPGRGPRRRPPRRGAGGMTITPSRVADDESPGCTVVPPHPIVTSTSHGTCLRPRTAGMRAAGVDRDADGGDGVVVADAAVGDDPGGAARVGAQGEDVAERAGSGLAARLDDDDLALADGVEGALLGVVAAAVRRRRGPRGPGRSAASSRCRRASRRGASAARRRS